MGVLLYWRFDMKKVIGLVLGLLPISVSAECVPVPDCASIGYTETSCDGDSLKCPFDTTKLKCIPCDSSFRYACSGDNVKNPIGVACNNKYVSCECEDRTVFINGECICDTSCDTIGNIYYSDGTCSSCNLTNKTPVAIVVHKGIITPLTAPKITWSSSNSDVLTLENLETSDIIITDNNGKNNTQKIIEHFASDTEMNNAAWYCYKLKIEGLEDYTNQWYLPSAGEAIKYFYSNYTSINATFNILNIGTFNGEYWTSTEETNWGVWTLQTNGNTYHRSRVYQYNVACLLAI